LVEAFVRIAPAAYEDLKRQQALRRLHKKGAVPALIDLNVPARQVPEPVGAGG
jgi:hypothetical protein